MSVGEVLVRILAELKPLLPSVITVVVATVLAMVYLYISGRHAWLKSKRFSLAGLFFGLDTRGIIGLSCAWLKLLLPVVYIFSFRELTVIQYLSIIVPGVILAACTGRLTKVLASLANLLLEMVGIVSASLICRYMTELRSGVVFTIIYIAIGIFLVLFAVYLFMQDLERISATRKVDAAQIWRSSEHEEEQN